MKWCLMLLLLPVVLASASAADNRDIVLLSSGRSYKVIVIGEKRDKIEFKASHTSPQVQTMRASDVVKITYQGMKGPLWMAGVQELNNGQYANAALRFQAVVDGSQEEEEWKRAYGLTAVGDAWEQSGQHQKAVEAFQRFVAELPEHRLFTNGLYRLGINQALAGDTAAAEATAKALDDFRKQKADPGAQTRAIAVRVVIAVAEKDIMKARQLRSRVVFNKRDGSISEHWGAFWASLLVNQGEYGEAARAYEELLLKVNNPGERAPLILGAGKAMKMAGKGESALAVLLQLDALPWGSPKQRTEARWLSAELRFAQAEKRLSSPKEKVVAFAKEEMDEARRLIELVSKTTVDLPEVKAAAQAWLAEHPEPETEQEAAEPAAE